VNGTIPQPPPGGDLLTLQRQLIGELNFTDAADGMLERRIARLEEIEASRWPRRILVRRRLRQDLRASVAAYDWAAPDWPGRRAQAIGDGWPPR
jgi:hypothetical protein